MNKLKGYDVSSVLVVLVVVFSVVIDGLVNVCIRSASESFDVCLLICSIVGLTLALTSFFLRFEGLFFVIEKMC